MSERGSALPSVMALVVAGLLLIGVAIDLGRWAGTWRSVSAAADAGARAGAGHVTPDSLYSGGAEVDIEAATEAARATSLSGAPSGRTAQVRADATQVCVVVTDVHLPGWLRAVGVQPTPVTATACAAPGRG